MPTHRLSYSNLLERPKRPLTAYNYFFHDARLHLLQTLPVKAPKKAGRHGKISFSDMAKVISAQWKKLDVEQMIHYANLANLDKMRYRNEMEAYKEQQHLLMTARKDQGEGTKKTNKKQNPTQTVSTTMCDDNITMMDPIMMIHPVPYHELSVAPSIADLARKLDAESIDLLVNLFK
eukprot:scaffold2880_cov173-Amphora_coffeaeformis.AAC.11